MNKTVVIGIASGIAAYKTVDLIKELKKDGINCFVTMTGNASKMVPPSEFKRASGNKVYIELFEKGFEYKNVLKVRKVDHIELADKADAIVVVPATANIIAKIANGFADDFLTTTLLAATCPVIICPSMNPNMYNNPTVLENVQKLKKMGYQIIRPASGMLACGYEGIGRLEDIEKIKDEVLNQLNKTTSLKGKRVLITAGGTREKIDDVRFITNRSSGKMGVALAEECYLRSAKVLLLRAKTAVEPRYLIEQKVFDSADDLEILIKNEIKSYDIVFHAAAVSDFSVQKQTGKIKSNQPTSINLKPRQKILYLIKKLNPKIKLVAFKAEYGKNSLKQKTYETLKKSGVDAVVANDISLNDRGFESDKNEVTIILSDKSTKKIPLTNKNQVAKNILSYLLQKEIL